MPKKQLVILGLITLFIIGVPLTLFIGNQQQEIRGRAQEGVPTPTPLPGTCPINPTGKIIVTFPGKVLVSNDELSDAKTGLVASSIPAGNYSITLVSYDNHINNPPKVQPAEKWYLKLKNSTGNDVAVSNAISDLPDNQDWLIQQVNDKLNIPQKVTSVQAIHAAYPNSNPNNIKPVCAAFALVVPTPTPKPSSTPTPKLTSTPTPKPTSTPSPKLTPTPTVKPTNTPTPSSTPTPKPTSTPIPTLTPTPKPTTTPTPSSTPTPTTIPTPTPTLTPGNTAVLLNGLLDGIGSRGDNSNPIGTFSNKNPLHPARSITVNIFNAANQVIANSTGTMNYDSSSGSFMASIVISQPLESGNYIIKATTDNHLTRLLPGIQNIISGQSKTLPNAIFIAGDIISDNQLDIRDYNSLIDCYSDLLPATACEDLQKKTASDLNDDGAVNQFDYNLFLREIATQPGE